MVELEQLEAPTIPVATPKKHLHALDGVRGIAILMVLAVHLEFMGDIVGTSPLMQKVKFLMWMGWTGVDLFFVLSGFLITGILLDTRSSENRVSSFYSRRALRIFPLYYLAVFGFRFLAPFFSSLMPLYPTKAGWMSYLLYIQNWYMPLKEPTHTILGQFWSLGVEEQFYLIWPACVWLVGPKHLIKVCAIGCLIAIGLRLCLYPLGPESAVVLMNTFTRMDTLLCGAFCAIVVRHRERLASVKRYIPLAAATSAAGMLAIIFVAGEKDRGVYTQSIGYSLLAVGYSCFVLYAYLQNGTRSLFDRVVSAKILRVFGKYSYGIYVYHGLVYFYFNHRFSQRGWLFSLVLVMSSLGVAMISFHVFESQFLRLKDRFRTNDLRVGQNHLAR